MIAPLELRAVAGSRGADGQAFIELPFRLYRRTPQWVPWFRSDVRAILDRRHPFFEHSAGAFFLARRAGQAVGRIAVLENTRYNGRYATRYAFFHLLEMEEDAGTAAALLEASAQWARSRGLTALVGPSGLGATTGSGVLVEGFEHRAAMTMMGYNFPYYARLLEQLGFQPHQNLYSARLDAASFRLPERVRIVAEKVLARGRLRVLEFRRKRELLRLAPQIGQVYNTAIGADHPETYPYTEHELQRVTRELIFVADPALIKVLAYGEQVAGFVFAFPDLSAALQRARGRLAPWALLDILAEYRRTSGLIVNGMGILPEFQRLGGNALLYYALERAVRGRRPSSPPFRHVDLTQVAETTSLMLSDLKTLGGQVYKTHRVYRREL
jgi:GNAT superfamily N-acetyltransferase